MNLNRRVLLWSGLGATIAAVFGREHVQDSMQEAEQAKLRKLYNPTELVQEAFQSDLKSFKDITAIQKSAKLRSPTIPYSRVWSKLLITGSKLCTEQYLRGTFEADYDGNIASLPLYTQGFQSFKQVASFKATEPAEETIPFEVPAFELDELSNQFPDKLDKLGNQLDRTQTAIQQQVKQVVKIHQKIPVYYGFLLTSPKANILMFRGTQRQTEWLGNILALLSPYRDPSSKAELGSVHYGIYDFYSTFLAKPVAEAVKSLDFQKPLLISGHSLGAGLATFAAMDLALLYPQLKPQIQLYAYAGPRVGNKVFIETHSQLIPNHYRVVNLADMIPLLPISKQLNAEFVHGGEQWSFLSYQGDIIPNHIVMTYRNAIEQEAETKLGREFENVRIPLG